MADTKKYQNPKATSSESLELQTRIACKGRTAPAVLDELARALAEAESRRLDPLIVLEDLAALQDSITSLMKGLSRLLVGYPRTVTFWESSGYTEAFLSVLERGTPPGV